MSPTLSFLFLIIGPPGEELIIVRKKSTKRLKVQLGETSEIKLSAEEFNKILAIFSVKILQK